MKPSGGEQALSYGEGTKNCTESGKRKFWAIFLTLSVFKDEENPETLPKSLGLGYTTLHGKETPEARVKHSTATEGWDKDSSRGEPDEQ